MLEKLAATPLITFVYFFKHYLFVILDRLFTVLLNEFVALVVFKVFALPLGHDFPEGCNLLARYRHTRLYYAA